MLVKGKGVEAEIKDGKDTNLYDWFIYAGFIFLGLLVLSTETVRGTPETNVTAFGCFLLAGLTRIRILLRSIRLDALAAQRTTQ